MLNIAVCDDSRTDVEMLESAFDKLAQYHFLMKCILQRRSC